MVANSARASALAIGAKARVKIRQELAYAPFVPNRTAGEVLWEIYERIGIKLEQGDEKAEMGSTDLGNLSWRVPALHPTIAITPGREVAPHSVEFARASASKQGLEAMKKAILAMALMGYRVMTDSNLRKKMKAELREKRKLK
jgi:metal-dependent amidase/aminoacylase/carboxypeptidase family protein